jgi:CRISPR-associated endonuclease/helicase Cas3
MEILAKSDGITLEQHTQDVRDEAAKIVVSRPFVTQKYFQRTGHNLPLLLDEIARWHDVGKAHPKWQTACRGDYEESKATGKNCGIRLMHAGIRHEIASLALMKNNSVNLPKCGWVAVAAHHRKLSERHHKRWHDKTLQDWQTHAAFWKMFQNTSSQFRADDSDDFEKVLLKRYEYDGPRAWLQLADGRASAKESGDELPELKSFNYKFPYETKRGVQQIITQLWDEPFAILRAPTGAGKTDATLLWAQHQIENNRADRLVIAMPTRFTSNALSVNIAENISQRGLYHSTSRFYEEEQQKNLDGFDPNFFTKEMLLARLLETPVTVTTIDHLCIALTGAREDHHGIFWGLAHSCVVIDEADFYDDFTQRNLIVLLRALKVLSVPVLIMSATVPESARELYGNSGFQPKEIYEDTSDVDRKRCYIERRGRVQTPDDISDLLCLGDSGPLIIYANTVERAQAYRKWFYDNEFNDEDVVLYHSRFCEPDKVEIEEKLIRLMGSEAWKKGEARGVAILTQIGELSVNISADVMISDICPIDRLAQRAGRLSRFHLPEENFIGQLYIVLPIKSGEEDEWYPAPYGRFAGGKWEMTDVLLQSNEWLIDGEYSPRDFSDLVNRLYPVATAPTSKARENARMLENSFVNNWLIVQNAELETEDDEQTHQWKSRDIASQQTVYVNVKMATIIDNNTPTLDIPNRMKFREWNLQHGVQIYGYQLEAARKMGALEQITLYVGEDTEKVWLVNENFYDLKYGLNFNREEENNDDFE